MTVIRQKKSQFHQKSQIQNLVVMETSGHVGNHLLDQIVAW